MPDFTAPEYASYVALMAEHPQEHEFRNGDWFWWPGGGSGEPLRPTAWEEGIYLYQDIADDEGLAPHIDFTARYAWLPQVADWLEMLEAEQIDTVTFKTNPAWPAEHRWSCEGELGEWWEGTGPTREEAAVRLWMAVTGK